jgi:Xaa-Pro aminopeptidase
MKRGLITWDKAELPPSVFETRLAKARAALAKQDLPALLVYSDVWRSTEGRHLTNYMPYWNRSLIVIPREQPPVLLCGLSPRVYPWIKSVTVFEEIRPASKLVPTLLQLCAERAWAKLGVLDLPRLPHEIYAPLEASDLQASDVKLDLTDDAEIAMQRRAEQMAREILAAEFPKGAGLTDCQFSGLLERAFRRAGAEDLVLLFSTDDAAPRPAHGAMLGDRYSVAVALEYRGHWARVRLGLPAGSLPL